MQYKDALSVQEGDVLYVKCRNYMHTRVLEIKHNRRYHEIIFCCTDGEYMHKEVILPISDEELSEKFIHDSKTRVYIRRKNEGGKETYGVIVEDTDDFCLASFDSSEAAEQYISEKKLKKIQ